MSQNLNLENSYDMIQKIMFYMKKFIEKDKYNTIRIFDLESALTNLDNQLEQKASELKDFSDLVNNYQKIKNPD